jgi:hypothetical protein
MPKLEYARFFDEQLEVTDKKVSDVTGEISKKYGIEYTVERGYDFLKGKNRPNAGEARAWEEVFGVKLPPRYYGFGEVLKP